MNRHELDWKKIDWEAFQLLVVYIAERIYENVNFQEYLKRGQKQKGIDILHFSTETQKHVCIQCKNVQKLTVSGLRNLIKEFESNDFVKSTGVFILATQFDLNNSDLQNEIYSQQKRLMQSYNIEFFQWDISFLNKELRKSHALVSRFFSPYDADQYCLSNVKEKNIPKNKMPSGYIARDVVQLRDTEHSDEIYRFLHYTSNDKAHLSSVFTRDRLTTHLICLTGDAHQGKSTLLKQTAYELENIESPYVCVVLDIKKYNIQPIDNLLELEMPSWKEIAAKDMIVIIDGVDEVPAEKFEAAVKYVFEFTKRYRSVNVIFACRKLFFYSANVEKSLPNFGVFELYPIQSEAIDSYIVDSLIGNAAKFKTHISTRGLNTFLYDPFYLVNLVEEYKTSPRTVPKTKIGIIEKYIERTYRAEEHRKPIAGYTVQAMKKKFMETIQKFAFALQLMGLNAMTPDIVREIFTQKEMDLLQHNGLLVVTDKTWSFTNSIFQEHLAALMLSKLPEEDIFYHISIGRISPKIKTKWIQTVSSLISLLDEDSDMHEKIVQFISDDSIELIFMTESAKYSSAFKIQTLQKLLSKCGELNMSPRIVDENTIAFFISHDGNAIDVVVKSMIKKNAPSVVKIVCARILKSVELTIAHKNSVLNFAQSVIPSIDDAYFANLVLELLAEHKIGSEALINSIINQSSLNSNHEFRDGVYQLIVALGKTELYYGYGLDGIQYLVEHNKNIHHAMSEFSLEELLMNTKNSRNLVRLFKAMQSEEWLDFYRHSYRKEQFMKRICNCAIDIYRLNPFIFFAVVDFVKSLGRQYRRQEYHEIDRFFDETNTNWLALRFCLNEIFDGKDWRLSSFITTENIDYIFYEFEERGLPVNVLWMCNLGLHETGKRDLAAKFAIEADNLTGGEYSRPTPAGEKMQQEYMLRLKNDREVIESIESFRKGIQNYFDAFGSKSIRENDLYIDVDSDFRKQRANSIFLYAFLSQRVPNKQGKIYLEDALKKLDEKGFFPGFRADVILSYHTYKDAEINEFLLKILYEYYQDSLDAADFVNCIWDNSTTGFRYRIQTMQLKRIFEKYEFDTPIEYLKKFIWLDTSGIRGIKNSHLNDQKSLSERIIARMSSDELTDFKIEICDNLRTGIFSKSVFGTHIGLCRHLLIFESVDLLLDVIQYRRLDDYDLPDVLDIYMELGGNESELLVIFKRQRDYNSYMYWQLVKLLYPKNQDLIKKSMLKVLKSNAVKGENKIKAAAYLSGLGELIGFKYLLDHISDYCKAPFSNQANDAVYNVDTRKALTMVDNLIYLTLNEERGNRDFVNPGGILLDWLNGFASKSEQDLILVYDFLISQVEKLTGKYSNSKNFYWFASRVIEKYRTSNLSNKSVNEVKNILKKIDLS